MFIFFLFVSMPMQLTEVDKTIASGCAMFYEQHNEAIKVQ